MEMFCLTESSFIMTSWMLLAAWDPPTTLGLQEVGQGGGRGGGRGGEGREGEGREGEGEYSLHHPPPTPPLPSPYRQRPSCNSLLSPPFLKPDTWSAGAPKVVM